MATFADKLPALRKQRGLTQAKAAKKLGLTRSTLAGYEAGLRTPSYDLAIKLCKFYSVPFDYFAEPEEIRPYEDITVEDVAERAKELGVNLTQLSAASGISYNTIRQAVSGKTEKAYLSKRTLRTLMDTMESFDFTVFPNYRDTMKRKEKQ